MNKIITYLKTCKIFIYYSISIIILFAFLFILGNLDFAYFWLGLELCLFILLSFLFINYLFYQAEEKKSLLIKNLKDELLKQQENSLQNKKDLNNYFLLWLHQIKTPLATADLLAKKMKNKDIKIALVEIENYINMAMSYLKIKEIKPDCDITNVSLNACLNNILVKYRHLFITKHLTLNYNFNNISVISDERYLEILLEQFISNALKYTDKGSITLSFNSQENALQIKDTGCGILKQDLLKIFDCGYSGYNGRYNQKASGLGLFLAQEIAKKLNIKISVNSTYHIGTSFTLYFPKNLQDCK